MRQNSEHLALRIVADILAECIAEARAASFRKHRNPVLGIISERQNRTVKGGSMDFQSIDVETANADMASICQIGIITVHGGTIVDTWDSLVDPEDYFDGVNIAIHGIDENTVRNAPLFSAVYPDLARRLNGNVVVSHTRFDRTAITRAAKDYELPDIDATWLDSARIVRRAWPDMYARAGYGLANVAHDLGIDFTHHDALEDARAAAEIVIHASAKCGLTIDQWLVRTRQPIDLKATGRISREGNHEGALFGEVLVFTGELTLPRKQAADMAAAAGSTVAASVTRKTTILVIGDQDTRKLGTGKKVSNKYEKAASLIKKGQHIKILAESSFRALIAGS